MWVQSWGGVIFNAGSVNDPAVDQIHDTVAEISAQVYLRQRVSAFQRFTGAAVQLHKLLIRKLAVPVHQPRPAGEVEADSVYDLTFRLSREVYEYTEAMASAPPLVADGRSSYTSLSRRHLHIRPIARLLFSRLQLPLVRQADPLIQIVLPEVPGESVSA